MPMFGSDYIQFSSLTETAQLVASHTLTITAIRAFASAVTGDNYVQLFDASTTGDVTVGTTKPTWVVMIPGTSNAAAVSDSDGLPTTPAGLLFKNGIVMAGTGGSIDNSAPEDDIFGTIGVV